MRFPALIQMNTSSRLESRRAEAAQRQADLRRRRAALFRSQLSGVPEPQLPSIEEDEARIAQLTQLRQARSEPAASTAAELVWRLITGAGGAPGLSIIEASMSELEKIQHFETLRLTNTDAAMRFANAANIDFVRTQIIYSTLEDPRVRLYRTSPVTGSILIALSNDAQIGRDYVWHLAQQSGKFDPDGHGVQVLIDDPSLEPWAHRYEVYVSRGTGELTIGKMSLMIIR